MKLYKSLSTATAEREEVRALKISIKSDNFPPEIFFLENLEELYLEGDCSKLPKLGSPWKKLKLLSIHWPKFQGDLSAFFSLPSLENLKIIATPQKRFLLPLGFAVAPLKSITIKDCGLENLPEEISMFTSLTEMNLSQNQLSKLPHSFMDLTQLKRLNLDLNEFSKFPDVIKKMPTLSHLSIDSNPFSEEEKDRIQREYNIWL